MPRPSRQHQLDHAAEATRAKIATQRKALAAIQSQQREEQRKARDKRRYQVGTLCDEAGLLGCDDATLRPLLALLSCLASVPNPVALLEGILADLSGMPGRSVDGFATPSECVSATH
jgi:hypothetical protein